MFLFGLLCWLQVQATECPPNTICQNATWRNDALHLITTNLTVAPGVRLTIEAGTQVRISPNCSLRAGPNATLEVLGTPEAHVFFSCSDSAGVFGEIAADGTNSFLTLRFADITAGAVKFRNGATGLIEDSYVHRFKNGSIPIAGCTRAQSVTVRRCHFNTFHETLWQMTPIVIEDSLFENAYNPSSDALDFDTAPPGSVIRRCTFRNGPQSNTDAIDLGDASVGVVVEDCLMANFPNDKGVSIGEGSSSIIIRNCLIYGCDSGVAVKDNCTATIYNCTIVNNDFGFRNYNKADPNAPTGGGHIIESYNNILWGNGTTISVMNGATVVADHSTFSNQAWPGEGIVSLDPLFLNETRRDYRVLKFSQTLTAGREGAPLGAKFPVGALMAPSHPAFESIVKSENGATLRFWMDANIDYMIASSHLPTGPWIAFPVGKVTRPQLKELFVFTSTSPKFYKLFFE